jgi:hypothetical protein
MKAEFNMRQKEREQAKPQQKPEPEQTDDENFDQDTSEPLKPGATKPPQSNQWHTSQQVGYTPTKPTKPNKDDDVTDVEPRPVNKPLGLPKPNSGVKENSADPNKFYQRPQLQFSAPQPPPKPARIWQPSVDGQNQKAQTDKNGRTQAQWVDMVMKKFPTARIAQGKGPFSKTTAILPDGRRFVWTPTMPETINAVSRPNMSGGSDSSGDPYDFIKPGAMVKFGMWNKPQEHRTGRVVKMADGVVTVATDDGKNINLNLGNKSLLIAPVSADQQGMAEGDISQLEKDIADAPVEPIANLEAQEKIGGRHDADDFDDMVSRLKKLAGAGPMKTVWDPDRRVYRNMPTAVQPPQQPKK